MAPRIDFTNPEEVKAYIKEDQKNKSLGSGTSGLMPDPTVFNPYGGPNYDPWSEDKSSSGAVMGALAGAGQDTQKHYPGNRGGLADWINERRAYWGQQAYDAAGRAAPMDVQVGRARGFGDQARQNQVMGQNMLLERAMGRDSVARMQGQQMIERAQRAIASRAASVPGAYNPAVAAAALREQAGVGQEAAGQISIAAAQERQAAQDAYLHAIGQQRQQEIAQQMAEQDWYSKQGQYGLGIEGLRQKYAMMGLTDEQAEKAAQRDFQKFWAQLMTGQMGSQQAAALQSQKNDQDLALGLMQGLGSLAMLAI